MDPRTFPTKGNLMLAKNSLALAQQGYDLMDKKRNILIRELMDLIDEARDIQDEIDSTFTYALQLVFSADKIAAVPVNKVLVHIIQGLTIRCLNGT